MRARVGITGISSQAFQTRVVDAGCMLVSCRYQLIAALGVRSPPDWNRACRGLGGHAIREELCHQLAERSAPGSSISRYPALPPEHLDTPSKWPKEPCFRRKSMVSPRCGVVTITAGGNDLQFRRINVYAAWSASNRTSPIVSMLEAMLPDGSHFLGRRC